MHRENLQDRLLGPAGRPGKAAPHRLHTMDYVMSITTGFFTGLGWGITAALIEGLPLLLQGNLWPHLGARLLALAYLTVIYGLLGALIGSLMGSLALPALRRSRRTIPWATLMSAYSGLFVVATLTAWWGHRFAPDPVGWIILITLASAAGLGVGWLLHRTACSLARAWPVFRSAVLVVFLLAFVTVLAVGGFRRFLQDLPRFNPPLTNQVATPERPNIVLITVGGLRPDHLGSYGYDAAISPNIDALAARGVRFAQAFAQASWTEPSLASLLTSLYPSELGIACRAELSCRPHLDEMRTTLAEALRQAGYHTQAYLTSPWLIAELGFEQGFDRFESVRNEEPFDAWPMCNRTLGRLLGCRHDSGACRLFLTGHNLLFAPPIPAGWGGDLVNARVTHFLELHRDELFFLWIHYSETLPPYNLEPPFRPLPDDPLASPTKRLKGMGYWELGAPHTPQEELLPHDVEGLTALYDGEVHRVDRLVGGLTGLLEAFGLTDRTLIIVTADHGQEFMEHGGYTYGHTLYDEVLHVPLIIAGAGVSSPGQVVETAVGLLDVAPTVAEIAGSSLAPEAEGHSLLPALQGKALTEYPILAESLYRTPYELKAIRQGGYKLIYNVDDGSTQLYDLHTDPFEQQEIGCQAIEAASSLKQTLTGWIAHTAQVEASLPRAVPPAEFKDATW